MDLSVFKCVLTSSLSAAILILVLVVSAESQDTSGDFSDARQELRRKLQPLFSKTESVVEPDESIWKLQPSGVPTGTDNVELQPTFRSASANPQAAFRSAGADPAPGKRLNEPFFRSLYEKGMYSLVGSQQDPNRKQPRIGEKRLVRLLTDFLNVPRFYQGARTNTWSKLLLKEFFKYGLDAFIQDPMESLQWAADSGRMFTYAPIANVVAYIPGKNVGTTSDRIIAITGHYDTHPNRTGLNDNASGIAVMLEIARTLTEAECDFDHTVMFVQLDQEEIGLLGSGYFVERFLIPKMKAKRANFQGAYNLDTIMNYNSAPHSQRIPDAVKKYAPELAEKIKKMNFKGDFMLIQGRRGIDDHLGQALVNNWRKLEKPKFKMFYMSATEAKTSKDEFQEFFKRGDHWSFWKPDEKVYNGTFSAVEVADTVDDRGVMKTCYHQMCDDDIHMMNPKNVYFIKKLGDALIGALLDLANGKCKKGQTLKEMIEKRKKAVAAKAQKIGSIGAYTLSANEPPNSSEPETPLGAFNFPLEIEAVRKTKKTKVLDEKIAKALLSSLKIRNRAGWKEDARTLLPEFRSRMKFLADYVSGGNKGGHSHNFVNSEINKMIGDVHGHVHQSLYGDQKTKGVQPHFHSAKSMNKQEHKAVVPQFHSARNRKYSPRIPSGTSTSAGLDLRFRERPTYINTYESNTLPAVGEGEEAYGDLEDDELPEEPMWNEIENSGKAQSETVGEETYEDIDDSDLSEEPKWNEIRNSGQAQSETLVEEEAYGDMEESDLPEEPKWNEIENSEQAQSETLLKTQDSDDSEAFTAKYTPKGLEEYEDDADTEYTDLPEESEWSIGLRNNYEQDQSETFQNSQDNDDREMFKRQLIDNYKNDFSFPRSKFPFSYLNLPVPSLPSEDDNDYFNDNLPTLSSFKLPSINRGFSYDDFSIFKNSEESSMADSPMSVFGDDNDGDVHDGEPLTDFSEYSGSTDLSEAVQNIDIPEDGDLLQESSDFGEDNSQDFPNLIIPPLQSAVEMDNTPFLSPRTNTKNLLSNLSYLQFPTLKTPSVDYSPGFKHIFSSSSLNVNSEDFSSSFPKSNFPVNKTIFKNSFSIFPKVERLSFPASFGNAKILRRKREIDYYQYSESFPTRPENYLRFSYNDIQNPNTFSFPFQTNRDIDRFETRYSEPLLDSRPLNYHDPQYYNNDYVLDDPVMYPEQSTPSEVDILDNFMQPRPFTNDFPSELTSNMIEPMPFENGFQSDMMPNMMQSMPSLNGFQSEMASNVMQSMPSMDGFQSEMASNVMQSMPSMNGFQYEMTPNMMQPMPFMNGFQSDLASNMMQSMPPKNGFQPGFMHNAPDLLYSPSYIANPQTDFVPLSNKYGHDIPNSSLESYSPENDIPQASFMSTKSGKISTKRKKTRKGKKKLKKENDKFINQLVGILSSKMKNKGKSENERIPTRKKGKKKSPEKGKRPKTSKHKTYKSEKKRNDKSSKLESYSKKIPARVKIQAKGEKAFKDIVNALGKDLIPTGSKLPKSFELSVEVDSNPDTKGKGNAKSHFKKTISKNRDDDSNMQTQSSSEESTHFESSSAGNGKPLDDSKLKDLMKFDDDLKMNSDWSVDEDSAFPSLGKLDDWGDDFNFTMFQNKAKGGQPVIMSTEMPENWKKRKSKKKGRYAILKKPRERFRDEKESTEGIPNWMTMITEEADKYLNKMEESKPSWMNRMLEDADQHLKDRKKSPKKSKRKKTKKKKKKKKKKTKWMNEINDNDEEEEEDDDESEPMVPGWMKTMTDHADKYLEKSPRWVKKSKVRPKKKKVKKMRRRQRKKKPLFDTENNRMYEKSRKNLRPSWSVDENAWINKLKRKYGWRNHQADGTSSDLSTDEDTNQWLSGDEDNDANESMDAFQSSGQFQDINMDLGLDNYNFQ